MATAAPTYAQPDLDRVMVVNSDEAVVRLVSAQLKAMGAQVVDAYQDGDAAWTALSSNTYAMIITDWSLPGLSGLAFLNRVRSLPQYQMVPMLIVSSLLERDDFRLLQEFAVTALLEKPFTKIRLDGALESLVEERDWYRRHHQALHKVFADRDVSKLEAAVRKLLDSSPNPTPVLITAARLCSKAKVYKTAEKLLRRALEHDAQSVVALNELGKALHASGNPRGAREMLRVANRISPQNFQRLCLLGEVELNLKDLDAARGYFKKALAIDPDGTKAKAGLTLVKNAALVDTPAHELLGQSFASILNTMGIALVRSGKLERGIEQYRASLAFIDDNSSAAKVAFNLGLGYLRSGQPRKALPWFRKSEKLASADFVRSKAYVKALTKKKKKAQAANGAAAPAVAQAPAAGAQEYVPGLAAPLDTPQPAAPPTDPGAADATSAPAAAPAPAKTGAKAA